MLLSQKIVIFQIIEVDFASQFTTTDNLCTVKKNFLKYKMQCKGNF